jgi:uridylate kinase
MLGVAASKGSDRIMGEPLYRRVVIKVSGESFAGGQSFGIDQPTIDRIAGDLIAAQKLGVEVAVVVGGGNIFRGVEGTHAVRNGDAAGLRAVHARHRT